MENKMFVKKTHIEDHGFSELDFDLQEEFNFDYNELEEFDEICSGQGDADGYPIKIDRVIEALTALKNLGATHVEMDYHCDHIGYEISGYEIRLATEEEIKTFTDVENARKEKELKRLDLQRQLRELDREGEALAKDKGDDLPF
jgi:hypothetical protein